jgi:carbon-monoxide dehydrogenase medium subunit
VHCPPFLYHRPTSLAEAVETLAEFGDDARPLAGGQSLLPMMKLRLAAPAHIVDLGAIPRLSTVEERGGELCVGAMVRHRIFEERAAAPALPILRDAARGIADQQVRNRGTMGGSIANADPAGDWAPVLLALGAIADIINAEREWSVSIDEILSEAYVTQLTDGDLIRQLRVPLPTDSTGSAYLAFKRRAGDFALASVALRITVAHDGSCSDISVAVGSVAPRAMVVADARAVMLGKSALDRDAAARLGDAAAAACDAEFDRPDTMAYKRSLIKVLTGRALNIAARRAQGEIVDVDRYQ